MNGICFAPMWPRADGGDKDNAYQAEAREWAAAGNLPPPIIYDNRKPKAERRKAVTSALLSQNTRYDYVAFFGFAGADMLQCGFTLDDVEPLALLLLATTAEDSTIEIHAVDSILDTSGAALTMGIAHMIADRMRIGGRWRGEVVVSYIDADRNVRTKVFSS